MTQMDLRDTFVPYAMDTFFNDTSPAGVADIFDTAIEAPGNGMFRVTICCAACTLTASLTRDSTTVTGIQFNGGAALTANIYYTFDLCVREGDAINLQTSAAVAVKVLNVDFVRAPV